MNADEELALACEYAAVLIRRWTWEAKARLHLPRPSLPEYLLACETERR